MGAMPDPIPDPRPWAVRVADEFACVLRPRVCDRPDVCWQKGKCHRDVMGYQKQGQRKRDVDAMRRKLLRVRECYSCHRAASDGHHIVFRSHGGDDVEENIAPLCALCHETLHKSVDAGELRIVRRQIGRSLARSAHREIEYVLGKLGRSQGASYLSRQYLLGARELARYLERRGT